MMNVYSENGDRVHPTNQQFLKIQNQYQSGVSAFHYNSSGNGTTYEGCTGWTSIPSAYDYSYDHNVYNEALSKAMDKIRGEIDLSIDLLQHSQTTDMLKSAAKVFKNYEKVLHAIKHQPSKVATNLWLQWVYGVKPTLSTIYDTVQLFKDGGPKSGYLRVTESAKSVEKKKLGENLTGSGIPSTIIQTSSKRCRFDLVYNLKPSVMNNLASLSSLNPASIAWEMMPYSFVLDWFYDVGGYLRNIESAYLYATQYQYGYVTEGVKIQWETSTIGEITDGFITTRIVAKGAAKLTAKKRTVLLNSPSPKIPRFKADLGSSRILSAVSLLRQRYKA